VTSSSLAPSVSLQILRALPRIVPLLDIDANYRLNVVETTPSTLLGQLDTCIGEWAKQDIEDLAKRN
jgi:hypothetical protein